jgi:transcriptional regulator with XRE-family HTH domain
MGIPALPFSKMMKKVRKPLGGKYIENPTTIGEKVRNRRLELGLLQKDVAEIMGVCEDTITVWENGGASPQVNLYPKVTKFLEYFPFEVDTSTLGGKIKMYRFLNGICQEQLAMKLGVNESTVFHYENDKHKPFPKILNKLLNMLNASPIAKTTSRSKIL